MTKPTQLLINKIHFTCNCIFLDSDLLYSVSSYDGLKPNATRRRVQSRACLKPCGIFAPSNISVRRNVSCEDKFFICLSRTNGGSACLQGFCSSSLSQHE